MPAGPLPMLCSLCSAESFSFLDFGDLIPMANKYPEEQHPFAEKFYHPSAWFCPSCLNIQLDVEVSRETMFVDYYYLSSVNKALVEHYTEFAKKKLKGAKFVVDVGSNDGILLKPLKDMWIQALGVDPSENVGKIANAAGFNTLVDFFNVDSVAMIKDQYGFADVVTGLSMFSHLQDPHQFIEDVKSLLTDDGRFIVEVEYNVEMVKKGAFERFYLDRIFYFSVTSFKKLFALHGMYLADAEVTKIHGGSLRVTAKKGTGRPTARVARLMAKEKWQLAPEKVRSFGYKAKKQVAALKNKLLEYKNRGLHVAAYGAPARLSTITNFGGIGPELIDFVVDDSPLKQGRYSPGKHIPIVSPKYLEKHRPDVLVIFAYDYFADIRKKLKGRYRFLFPIPPREVK